MEGFEYIFQNNFKTFSRRNPSPDTIHFLFQKYAKTHLQQSRTSKIFRGFIPGLPLKEEGSGREGGEGTGGTEPPSKIPGSASASCDRCETNRHCQKVGREFASSHCTGF